MNSKLNFKNFSRFLLPGILLLAFFLRVWKIPELYYFGIDEEIMDLIERRIALWQHIPLIGSFSPIGTYLGPYFYYFGSLLLFFSRLNPLGQAYFSAILGTIVTFLIYKVGEKLYSRVVGIIAAFLYSSSFLMVIFDRRYWHLTPGPLLSLLVLYSLYKIKVGSIKYIYLLTAALIWGWNTDYTNLILFLFTFVAWIVFRLPVRRKEVLIAILIFIVSNAPLIAFDLRHDFLNSQKFLGYFTHKYKTEMGPKAEEQIIITKPPLQATRVESGTQAFLLNFYTYSRLLYTNSEPNITLQQSYCKQYINQRIDQQGIILLLVAIFFIFAFCYLALNEREKIVLPYRLILVFYLVFISGIFIYSFVFHGDVFEHYQATLLPIYVLMTAVVLAKFYHQFPKTKYFLIGVLGIWLVANINLTLRSTNPLGFESKNQAVKYALTQVGQKPFYLDSIGSCHSWDGFYYTFLLNGRHPDKSYLDDSYSWLYDYTPLESKPNLGVVIVPRVKVEDQQFYEKYNYYNKMVKTRASFQDIEVLIIDDKEQKK